MAEWEGASSDGASVSRWWNKYASTVCECDKCQAIAEDAFWAGAWMMLRHLQDAAVNSDGNIGPFVDAQEKDFDARFRKMAAVN